MNTTNKKSSPDDKFDQELRNLHQAALFNPDFQEQISDDFKSLSEKAQQQLHKRDKAYIKDANLSAQDIDDIIDLLPKQTRKEQASTSWWKQSFFSKEGKFSFFDPRLAMAYTFAMGIGTTMFFQQQSQFRSSQENFRGGFSPVEQQKTASKKNENSPFITTQTRSDPDKWMAAIVSLLEQGEIDEAKRQLESLIIRWYPKKTEEPPIK